MSSRTAVFLSLSLCTLALMQTACRDREVQAYRVPKEPAVPPELAASLTPAMPAAASSGALRWNAPAGWIEKEATSMRRGSFTVTGPGGAEADLSIIAFPGDAGGLLENLNRWRGQVSLPALAPSELDAALDHLDVGPLHMEVVDFVGSAGGVPTRILGGIFTFGGESWFVKLMGPDAVVAGAKADFIAFLQTIEVSS